jgi:arsenate reductase
MKIYHNPRCSKSREALRLLREHGVEPEVAEYLKSPPTLDELKTLKQRLGVPAMSMIRTKEPEFQQARLSEKSSDDEILEAVTRFPKLLERPIVLSDNRAVIGRPPERVLELLR